MPFATKSRSTRSWPISLRIPRNTNPRCGVQPAVTQRLAGSLWSRSGVLPFTSRARRVGKYLDRGVRSGSHSSDSATRPVLRSARRDALVAGRNLVRRRNGVACHQIKGDGGRVTT